MGQHTVTASRDAEQMRFFMKCVLRDLEALEHLLSRQMFETGHARIGAEQEMFLVDASMHPAMAADKLLPAIDDPHFTYELALFNLEANLDPLSLRGNCLSRMHQQCLSLLDRARAVAAEHDLRVVMTGILPSLRKEDLCLEAMTPLPRYRALNQALRRPGDGLFRLRIKGPDELRLSHDSMMLEACNASFQVHLQVDPEDFARLYNISQLLAAPVTAAAVNSPLLFGHRLWRETRLALFQQSVDTRSTDVPERALPARVSFGTKWVEHCVTEIFKEDIARFRALIGTENYRDPFDAIEAGHAPELDALRLHNGTVYRWNRACYGVGGGKPHLRIENRLLPSGPTVADEIANATFWLGLVHGMDEHHGDPKNAIDFDEAKANLLAAARLGLGAQFRWIDGARYPAAELILEHLLPLAAAGLETMGVAANDSERYLGIIRDRVDCGQTGAQWMVRSLAGMRQRASDRERAAALVEATLENQLSDNPVHRWPLAELTKAATWSEHYARVDSFMVSDIFTVHEDELVDLAAKMMDWSHIRHVPVEDDEHHLVGLVTHRRLLRFLLGSGGQDRQVPVGEIMEPDPVTIRPGTSSLEAMELMRQHRISCLPVTDSDNRLVGIVTDNDFMGVAADLLRGALSHSEEGRTDPSVARGME